MSGTVVKNYQELFGNIFYMHIFRCKKLKYIVFGEFDNEISNCFL